MVDSLFLSPAFILTESSFIIVASIAAYELLIGDFIWAQQEEARRASMQSHNRGRVVEGYNSFAESRQLHGHRSLSPRGGRGRGGGQRGGGSRRGSNVNNNEETTSLLYPPRSTTRGIGVIGGNRHDARISEERYYASSPGDPKFASPGRGSTGDSTRRLFYKVILLALLSRFILLPAETFCLSGRVNLRNIPLDPIFLQILLRLSQTLPDIAFASALGLLVIFCANIAFAAMPPLTPELNEGSTHGNDAGIIEEGTPEREGLLGEEGGTKFQQTSEGNVANNFRLNRSSKMARSLCTAAARLSRTILASKKTFVAWNTIIFTSYILVFVTAAVIPHAPLPMCEIYLWMLLGVIYCCLLLSLIYVAALLGKALHPGMVSRNNSNPLALRLVGTCTLLGIMFIERVVCFAIATHDAIVNLDGGDSEENMLWSNFRRTTIEYSISESLPVLFILFMMHRKRKEVHNDVLIIHSIMNNLFGSTGMLGSSESGQLDSKSNTTGEGGTGSSTVRSGGLGSRRFQTYGGSRGDSFPPALALGNKPRRNIPRAVSSSGSGRPKQQTHGQQQQHQQQQHNGNAADALALESGSSKKAGLMPYAPGRTMTTGRDGR